jgi:V/A-type H+-transporting ATPase subunit E
MKRLLTLILVLAAVATASAQAITEEAKAKAADVVNNAKAEAEAIVAAAEKKAAELEEHSRSEIKLYGTQAVSALKSEAADIITDNIAKAAAKEAIAGDTIKALLVKIAERWSVDEPVVISTAEVEQLKAYFAKNAKALLDKGVTIEQVNGKKTQFSIAPADGSYKVNFGEGEFEAFFKAFLRPQMVELLFDK